jgi:hypothetical protein
MSVGQFTATLLLNNIIELSDKTISLSCFPSAKFFITSRLSR